MPSKISKCLLLTTMLVMAGLGPSLAEQIKVPVWMHEHPPRLPLDKTVVAEFQAAHPDIQIDLTVFPNAEYDQKLQVGFASGDGPALFNNASFNLGQYMTSKLLAPVDLAVTGSADLAALGAKFGVGINGAVFGGVAYGLPTEVSNYACVANNALWKAAGLDPAKDAPKTWEQMKAIAEKLTVRDSGGVPTTRGFDFNWSNPIFMWLTFNAMVNQLGGSAIDEAALKANFNTPEVKRVLGFWDDWANKWKLGGPQYTGSRDAFLAGQLATECTFGSWGRGQFKTAGISYTFFAVPRWADAKVDTGFNAYSYYMMVNAKVDPAVQKAAWQFANFYASKGKELYEVAGLFTTVPSVQTLPSYLADASNKVFTEELTKAIYSPRVPGFNELGDALARARDRVVVSHEPIDAVLTDLQTEAAQILARY